MYLTEKTQITFPSPTKIFTPTITTIIVLIIIGFALVVHATNFTYNNLALITGNVFQGKIWVIFTYPFINGNPWNLIFGGFIILFMGSSIEREWGAKSFIFLWLVLSVICGLIWIIISLVFNKDFIGTGSSPCVYGIIATFGILYRGTRLWFYFFTLEAQYIAMILIGVGAVISIAQPMLFIWVLGALVAYIYVKMRLRPDVPRAISPQDSDDYEGFVDID